jgi:hypothetical protein
LVLSRREERGKREEGREGGERRREGRKSVSQSVIKGTILVFSGCYGKML